MSENSKNKSLSIDKMKEKLRKIAATIGVVLDCLEEEILIISEDFEIFHINRSTLDKLGFKKNEVIGNYCHKVTHHQDKPCQPPLDICPIKQAQKTGKAVAVVHTHFDKKDNPFFVNVISAPIKEKDKIIGFLHLTLLVKKREKKEKLIKKALKKTETIMLAVENFRKHAILGAIEKEKRVLVEKYTKELEQKVEERTKKLKELSEGLEEEIRERTKELRGKVEELGKFQKLSVGRELKMIELKEKIKKLEKILGKSGENI